MAADSSSIAAELDVLFPPDTAVVETSLGAFTITRITIGQLAKVMRHCWPLAAAVARAGDSLSAAALFAAHSEALFAAVALLVDRSPEELEQLPPEDFIALVSAVLEVNADFFTRLGPQLEQMASLWPQTPGETSSSG